MNEEFEEANELHDEITAMINRHPDLTVYQTLGILECIKFTMIERLPIREIDRSPKLLK